MKYVKIKLVGSRKRLKKLTKEYYWLEFDVYETDAYSTVSFGKLSEFLSLLEDEEGLEWLEVQLSFM